MTRYIDSCCSCTLSIFSIETLLNRIEISMPFRISNFVKYRGLWSPEPEERRIRSSTKQRNVHSTPLEKSRTWRIEHQWSAASSLKIENSSTQISDDNQSLGLSSFRHAANELERLRKEARDLTRRKAEEQQAEVAEAHDGKLID